MTALSSRGCRIVTHQRIHKSTCHGALLPALPHPGPSSSSPEFWGAPAVAGKTGDSWAPSWTHFGTPAQPLSLSWGWWEEGVCSNSPCRHLNSLLLPQPRLSPSSWGCYPPRLHAKPQAEGPGARPLLRSPTGLLPLSPLFPFLLQPRESF